MNLPADFYERLPERSDEDLYEMLAHTEDYLPEALKAACEELRHRNLTPEKAARLEVATQAAATEDQRKADEPLGWLMRILILAGICSSLWVPVYCEYC
jgi:hypothetical protein